MKRFTTMLLASAAMVWSYASFAAPLGVVDMQTIFHSSAQIQEINAKLNKEFSGRKAKIVKQGEVLQADLSKLNKNKSVMKSSDVNALKAKINKEEMELRQAQQAFQKDLFTAQNDQMTSFMDRVKTSVQKIAKEKKLALVLPKNAVLYSKGSLNITNNVLDSLK